MKTNRRVGQTECYARRLYLPVDKTARRGNGRSSYTPSQHNDIDLPDDHSGISDHHNYHLYYLCPFKTEYFARGLAMDKNIGHGIVGFDTAIIFSVKSAISQTFARSLSLTSDFQEGDSCCLKED